MICIVGKVFYCINYFLVSPMLHYVLWDLKKILNKTIEFLTVYLFIIFVYVFIQTFWRVFKDLSNSSLIRALYLTKASYFWRVKTEVSLSYATLSLYFSVSKYTSNFCRACLQCTLYVLLSKYQYYCNSINNDQLQNIILYWLLVFLEHVNIEQILFAWMNLLYGNVGLLLNK